MPATKFLPRYLLTAILAGGLLLLPQPGSAQLEGPDLSVSKTDSPDPVAVGADLTYTITVTNDGPIDAAGVTVTDALVLTVDFVSATPSQGSCSEIALLVTCDLGTILNGSSATVTLVVKPGSAGSLLNAASAVPAPPALDPDPTNNVAVESTTVTGDGSGPGADLAISKADAPDPVAPGGILNYTVTVQNTGPEAASGVLVTDVLPPLGVTFVSAAPSQGSCGAPVVLILTCDVGGLAFGGSATIQIAVQSAAEGSVVNTATVVATSLDPNPQNNAAAATTKVSASAGGGGGGGGGAAGGPQGLAACTIMGTPLDDKLKGTEGNDVICGLEGNDIMTALGGKDIVIGGKGNDRANGGKGPDKLKGQDDKDKLRGSSKNDRLAGGTGNDRLNGGKGKDKLNGGKGKDKCKKGKGDKIRACP